MHSVLKLNRVSLIKGMENLRDLTDNDVEQMIYLRMHKIIIKVESEKKENEIIQYCLCQ